MAKTRLKLKFFHRKSLNTVLLISTFLVLTASATAWSAADRCAEIFLASFLGMNSSGVTPRTPQPSDYKASLEVDGYQIVRRLNRLNGMKEADLYRDLKIRFGDQIPMLIAGTNGRWYSKQPNDVIHDAKFVISVQPIELPTALSSLLMNRMTKMQRLRPSADWNVDPSVEIRAGETGYAPRRFHADSGRAIRMVESLNRGPVNRATLMVGREGNIFEPLPDEAVLFTAKSTPGLGPPPLHASPPSDGERIFISYSYSPKPISPITYRYRDSSTSEIVLEVDFEQR